MPDITTIEMFLAMVDKLTAVAVLSIVIYLFVTGRIVAKASIDKTVIKIYKEINGDNVNDNA